MKIKKILLILILGLSLIPSINSTYAATDLGYTIIRNDHGSHQDWLFDVVNSWNSGDISTDQALSTINDGKSPTDDHYFNISQNDLGIWNITCNNGSDIMNLVPPAEPAPINGVCGTNIRFYDTYSESQIYNLRPNELCATSYGNTTINKHPYSNTWNWACNGNSTGQELWCSVQAPKDGVCGVANGQSYTPEDAVNVDPTNLCGINSTWNNSLEDKGTFWEWGCLGDETAKMATCSANKLASKTDGVCGYATQNSPATDEYKASVASDPKAFCFTDSGYKNLEDTLFYWAWTCNGENGGAEKRCQLNKVREAGKCGYATSQSPITLSYANSIKGDPKAFCEKTGYTGLTSSPSGWTWTCYGINGGANTNCSASLKDESVPVNGKCGYATKESPITLERANAIVGDPKAFCETTGYKSLNSTSSGWSWICLGANGGAEKSCSASLDTSSTPRCGYANGGRYTDAQAASTVSKSGAMCTIGSYSNLSGSWRWNCGTASCSATRVVEGEPTTPTTPPLKSCSYIRSYSYSWSSCSIDSNWTSNGTTTCTQRGTPIANRSTYSANSCYRNNAINPGYRSITNNLRLNLSTNNCSTGNIYADGLDVCNLIYRVSGIPSQGVSGLNGKIIKNVSFEGGFLDGILKTGNKGIIFSNTSFSNDKFTIEVKSKVPLNETKLLTFDIEGISGFTKIELGQINLNFKKIYRGILSLIGADKMLIGTEQGLLLTPEKCDSCPNYYYNISNFSGSLSAINSDYIVQEVNGEKDLTTNPKINYTLNYIGNTQIGTSGISVLPYISYSIGGDIVKYILGLTFNGGDDYPLELMGAEFLGVKIIGTFQGDGKTNITGQGENFSEIDKLGIKSSIEKNAHSLTKFMTSGQVLNGVKYVEGDIEIIGDDLGYNTLIVKDGNVIITGDLNKNKDKLGIVVLKSGYDVTKDYLNKGNVYVTPNVNYINSTIYSNGGFISVDYDKTPFTDNSFTRTTSLQQQLVLEGTLFTKNMIGGAILSGGNYLLPGSKMSSSLDNAIIYDLNYIRRGNIGWDGSDNNNDGNNYNKGFENPFIIIYDPRLQTDPLDVFQNK